MPTNEKMYIFRENGKLYIAKESAYKSYMKSKHNIIRCTGFSCPMDVVEFMCDGTDYVGDDFVIVI